MEAFCCAVYVPPAFPLHDALALLRTGPYRQVDVASVVDANAYWREWIPDTEWFSDVHSWQGRRDPSFVFLGALGFLKGDEPEDTVVDFVAAVGPVGDATLLEDFLHAQLEDRSDLTSQVTPSVGSLSAIASRCACGLRAVVSELEISDNELSIELCEKAWPRSNRLVFGGRPLAQRDLFEIMLARLDEWAARQGCVPVEQVAERYVAAVRALVSGLEVLPVDVWGLVVYYF